MHPYTPHATARLAPVTVHALAVHVSGRPHVRRAAVMSRAASGVCRMVTVVVMRRMVSVSVVVAV